ncbi:MAG: hypothetical protein WCQ45_02695 [bacterium]
MLIRRLLGAALALLIVAAGVAVAAPLRLGLVTDVHAHDTNSPNQHAVIDGVHYITLAAMIDRDEPLPPTWATVTLDPEARTVRVDGAGLQEDVEFSY